MTRTYGCYCFAIPHKMLSRLAADSPQDQRDTANGHLRPSAKLRSLRYEAAPPAALASMAKTAKPKKARRQVFDAGSGEDLPGRLVRGETGKASKDEAANQAFENLGTALRFYREVFGRNSVDGRGMGIDAAVHFGANFRNAMWNGRQMIFGDGDDTIGGFTASLDIIAHELSHGVTQHMIPKGLGVVRLPLKEREFKEQKYSLKGQGGALNESFSDIVGSMVKQWHAGQAAKEADWLIGERLLAPVLGRAIRSLKDPGNRKLTWHSDDQIKSMDAYAEDCDVHDASGIPNHAFYRAAIKMKGHSWEKAGPIWFDAYPKLSAKATFEQAARATIAAADARFGVDSSETKAVKAAWRDVKVI
ncbi:M4 family metallopeptidase [Ramlibacter sp. WS9]|uniref:M4 family metallopeptidase n=1 Tax=Ramlibacter sp. WS9 TaxID=1882741 RepID=UPI0011441389|nr:M4 family metallopeptidase [Ramlibacter sp. WS9]ROZ68944.1 M4 family peptidase [Ramlibacter sp. WS9]